MIETYLEQLQADPLESLRWYVARTLGIAPYAQTDEQVVKCGLHLLTAQRAWEQEGSSTFDEGRFLALKEAEYHEA